MSLLQSKNRLGTTKRHMDRSQWEADVRQGVPVQTVDATPSNQLIRRYFRLKNRPFWLYSVKT